MMSDAHCRCSVSSSCCSSSRKSLLSSLDEALGKDLVYMSVQPTHLQPSTPDLQWGKMIPEQSSLNCNPEKVPGYGSTISIPWNHTSNTEFSKELRKEIALLEYEIMHLEMYLLSLYRTVFKHLPSFPDKYGIEQTHCAKSLLRATSNKSYHEESPHIQNYSTPRQAQAKSACESFDRKLASPPKAAAAWGCKNADSRRCSLADYFKDSIFDDIAATPDRLSEHIVRCIASLYCKLAHQSLIHDGIAARPSSSSSCYRSTYSPETTHDGGSVNLKDGAKLHKDIGSYAAIIQVLRTCLDDESFSYATKLLDKFRLLVRSLETIELRKMKREEKLAFWINIHNALVMHAHLAYGTCNQLKSSSIMKAAYNVGGHFVNAYIIQSSVLRIQSHFPSPWPQWMFSPAKNENRSLRHAYAIEYPEPLVHFALSMGAYTDPAVRVYKSDNIFQDLKAAQGEFIGSQVHVHKERKILMPKILKYFAKDMSLSGTSELLEAIKGCLTPTQRNAIERCKRADNCIHWLPYDSTFRYVIHTE